MNTVFQAYLLVSAAGSSSILFLNFIHKRIIAKEMMEAESRHVADTEVKKILDQHTTKVDLEYLHKYNCPRCGVAQDRQGLCGLCVSEKKTIQTTVTDFDADMPCPWCDAEGPHYLREAHPAPKYDAVPELRQQFAAFNRDTKTLERGYAQYLRRHGDVVIEGFGQATPVKVIMNDPAMQAAAQKLRPPRVSLDSPRLSRYDHPDAVTIRTCIKCKKEWSQK